METITLPAADEAAIKCAAKKLDAIENAGLNPLHRNPVAALIFALRFYANASEDALLFDAGITASVYLEDALSDVVSDVTRAPKRPTISREALLERLVRHTLACNECCGMGVASCREGNTLWNASFPDEPVTLDVEYVEQNEAYWWKYGKPGRIGMAGDSWEEVAR